MKKPLLPNRPLPDLESKEELFLQLWNQHSTLLYSISKKFYPCGPRDVIQESLLKLWKLPISRFIVMYETAPGSLVTLVKNTALDLIRKDTSRMKREEVYSNFHQLLGDNEGERELLLEDQLLLGNRLLGEDSCEYKVFKLLLQGYGNKEISFLLDMNENTVATKKRKIKGIIKRKIETQL